MRSDHNIIPLFLKKKKEKSTEAYYYASLIPRIISVFIGRDEAYSLYSREEGVSGPERLA